MILQNRTKESTANIQENFDEIFGADLALPITEATSVEFAKAMQKLEEAWGGLRENIYINEFIELTKAVEGAPQEEIDAIAEASAGEMYQSVINWFKQMGATVKKYIDEYLGKMKIFFTRDAGKLLKNHPIAEIAKKDLSGFKVKTFDWWAAESDFADKSVTKVKLFIEKMGFGVGSLDGTIKGMSDDNFKSISEKYKGLSGAIYTELGGTKAEFKKTMAVKLKGSESKSEVAITADKAKTIAKFLGGSSEGLTSIKKMKDMILSNIAKTIKEVEGLKKRFGKNSDGASMNDGGSRNSRTSISGAPKGQESNVMKFISIVIGAQKTSSSVQKGLLNAKIAAYTAKTNAFMGIYRALASYSPKKTKEENTNESFLIEAVAEMEGMLVL